MLQCIPSKFVFLSLSECFAVNSTTSTHHNISLGQCQRQCMVSTYFGYKVFIHESPSPPILWWVRVAHLFSFFVFFFFGLCVVCTMLPLFLDCPFGYLYLLFTTYSLSSVLYTTQFCQFLWIFHSWLPLRCSLTFIYSGNNIRCIN